MHVRWLQKRSNRLLVVLLVLPALALRVMVPPGFMPGTGADDAPTMQMCHGAGPLPESTQRSPAGDDPAPGPGTHHEAPCVFAAAGATAPPPVLSAALVAPHAVDAGPSTPELTFSQRSVHRDQAARAPPPATRQA